MPHESRHTHSLCKHCYGVVYPDHRPAMVKDAEHEKCCRCSIISEPVFVPARFDSENWPYCPWFHRATQGR